MEMNPLNFKLRASWLPLHQFKQLSYLILLRSIRIPYLKTTLTTETIGIRCGVTR